MVNFGVRVFICPCQFQTESEAEFKKHQEETTHAGCYSTTWDQRKDKPPES
jgi:hypothetical protein